MKVSVVVPCFDAASWIGEALRSAAAQRARPHEIIVVDDGSTDGSQAVVDATGIDVRRLSTARAGGAGARNAGIRAATGDLVAFLDADDVWYPEHLERATELLGDDVAGIAHYDHVTQDGTIEPLPPFWPVSEPSRGLTAHDFLRLFLGHQFFAMSSLVVRRERLLEVGLLDESQRLRHDIELFLRLITGRTWSFDPRPGYAYRKDTPGSLSRNRPARERFFLRALLLNREALAGPEMDALLRLGARRAMSHAFTFGDDADRTAAAQIAAPCLSASDRAIFVLASLSPSLFGRINRARLKLTGATPT